MAPLTIRAQLERWIIEEEVGDGTYRRVPLIEYVNRWIAEARVRERQARVAALSDTEAKP